MKPTSKGSPSDRTVELQQLLEEQSLKLSRLGDHCDGLQRMVDAYRTSLSWRYTGWIRKLVSWGMTSAAGQRRTRCEPNRDHDCRPADDAAPLISVLTPVYRTKPGLLRQTVESVRGQCYPRWELILVADGPQPKRLTRMIARLAAADPRIRALELPEQSGISGATNKALSEARGEYIALLDHDDLLAPHALCEVAQLICRHPETDFVYTDEDKVDGRNRHFQARFKPEWSPELLLSQMYTAHLSVYRRAIARQIGGFRGAFDGSQDYDFALRFTERTERVRRIPRVLYHWRATGSSVARCEDAKPYAYQAALKALQDAYIRRGYAGEVVPHPRFRGIYRPQRAPLRDHMVSIIIPTRDGGDMLDECISSIVEQTSSRNYEIVVLDNGSRDPETLRMLSQWRRSPRCRVIRAEIPFNHSTLCNLGAAEARGDLLLLLNDDTIVQTPGWLQEMAGYAEDPNIGAVGCMLLYPNGSVQHAGVILGLGGTATHVFQRHGNGDPGYFGLLHCATNYCSVTAACLMVEKRKYLDCGGMDEHAFPTNLNDVDFCLRLRERNLRNVYLPFVRLVHRESATRKDGPILRASVHLLRERWARILERDPYYNPNLTTTAQDFSTLPQPRY